MDTLKLVLSDSFSLCWAQQSTTAESLCGWDALVRCAPCPTTPKTCENDITFYNYIIPPSQAKEAQMSGASVAGWECLLCSWPEWSARVGRGPVWQDVSTCQAGTSGRMLVFWGAWDRLCFYAFVSKSVCVCVWVFLYFCVFYRERGSSCRSQGAPGLYKTSAPAGRLQGRSGCVDSFLRQMKEQKWLGLVSPAHMDASEDGTARHFRFGCN